MAPAEAHPLAELRSAVRAAADELRGSDPPSTAPPPSLDTPKRPEFGDFSSNAAMLLAPALRSSPRDVAARLADALTQRLGQQLERVEVAGPGFVNLFLADAWYRDALGTIVAGAESFGLADAAKGERVLVEFVSANPTGPLTAAGGRHAAYGDAVARLLEAGGHAVEREYYVNDYGSQVLRLGESIRARVRAEDIPEGGYEGDYVRDLAAQLRAGPDDDPAQLARAGAEALVAGVRATLERFRVTFDTWFSERSLHEGDAVERDLERLREGGHVYESEGALWLRTSTLGDEKDRVLRRSSGEHTYFAADIAYHEDKRARGFDRVIDVWGADHHGHVERMRAAWRALGGDPEALELIIMQFVNVIERGERASMSKRRGDFVTLDELIDEIGVDATRYFLLTRSHDTTVDLDLDLARRQSADNPVYYVQYAHARIASVLRKAGEERVGEAIGAMAGDASSGPSLDPAERALIRKLAAFPDEVAEAAARRAPHRIAAYALELAQEFTAFYRDCQVVGAEPAELESFRIALSATTRSVIARALGLLGIEAPEVM